MATPLRRLVSRLVSPSALHFAVLTTPLVLVAASAAGCSAETTSELGAALDVDPEEAPPALPHEAEETETEEPSTAAPADAGAPEGGTDASADAGLPKPPRMALLRAGLHPDASDALRVLGITAAQITQTIGNAAASAGTHAKDGVADGKDYGAATDISVRGMTDAQIKTFLNGMTQYGFAGWYRKPGADGWPASEAPHFHVIYVGAPMKLLLRNQCRDFFVNKNGLASHTTYQYVTWTQAQRDAVKAVYVKSNSLTN